MPFSHIFSLIYCTCFIHFISEINIYYLLSRCCATELQAEIGQPIDWHSLARDSPCPWLQLWTALWTLPWKFLLKVIFFGKLHFVFWFTDSTFWEFLFNFVFNTVDLPSWYLTHMRNVLFSHSLDIFRSVDVNRWKQASCQKYGFRFETKAFI